MTLEEVKQLAEQGDIGAMCSLGDFYIKQNTGEGITEAAKWYEMAAERNVVYAVHMAVLAKKILSYAGLQIADGSELGWNYIKKDWQETYDWALREMRMLNDKVAGAEKIDRDQAIANYNDALYHLALCNYEQKNYKEVVSLLKDKNEKRAKILYGSALLDMANYDDEYQYAFQQFKFIDGDVEYASARKSKYEEKVYAVAALALSQTYRLGLGKNDVKPDMEKSVKLLSFVRTYLANAGMKDLVDEELQHYQKKMFGGYKYV